MKTLKLSEIVYNPKNISKEGVYIVLNKITFNIPLLGIVNIKEEINKMSKNKEKLNFELLKVNKKLKNKTFIKKAPKSVVDNFYNQSKNIKTSIEKIEQIINSLK